MQTQSDVKLNRFVVLGPTLFIHFNEREETSEEGEVSFHYDTVKVCKSADRDERIEAIIKTKYPTYGSELAAMHKGGEHEVEYNLFREQAKQLADESFNA